jgi:hypothetical protein
VAKVKRAVAAIVGRQRDQEISWKSKRLSKNKPPIWEWFILYTTYLSLVGGFEHFFPTYWE